MKVVYRWLVPCAFLVWLPARTAGQRVIAGGHETVSAAGTYEVRICRPACSPDERADGAHGKLVIEDAAYPWATVPQPGRNYAFRKGRFLLVRGRAELDPNACFVLRRTPDSRMLAGYPPVGFTAWSIDTEAGLLRVRLSQTPDASYVLDLRVLEHGVSARGTEYGPPGTAPVVDSVTITRLGPPDRSICTAAASRGAAIAQVTDSIKDAIRTPRSAVRLEGASGTYEVEICPDRCRRGWRRSIRGRVVLEDSAYRVTELPREARRYAIEATRLLLIMADGPNACFVFDRGSGTPSYVGRQPAGFTRWSAVEPAGTLRVDLFATDDGEYTARLALAGDRLTGEGWSLVTNPFDDLVPSDVIRGRRVGPPDRGLCIYAAERAAADLPPAP